MIIMKKLVLIIFAGLFTFGMISNVYSQCTPDEMCVDTADPGQICPMVFAVGYVDVPYEQVVTFIPPTTFNYSGFDLEVTNIIITEVTNLPEGLSWDTNADEFPPTDPITRYCGVIYGTPTTAGEYVFDFNATVTVLLFGNPVDVPVTAATLNYQPQIIILEENQAPPTAEFSANETTVAGGTVVTFTDDSFNAGAWAWTFEGGDPASSTEQHPTVTYNTQGEYDVTLVVTNTNTTDTDELLMADYITVTSTVHVTPEFAEKFKVYPNPTTSYFTVKGEEMASIRVLNSIGQVVFESSVMSNTVDVDVNEWSTGWYILEVNDGEKTVRANISVE
jgi:PKD repeat protein